MDRFRRFAALCSLCLVAAVTASGQTPAGGTLDTTFATAGIRQFSLANGSLKATDVAFASNGAMYVIGTMTVATKPQFNAYMIKLTSAGLLDSTFNTTGGLIVPAGEPVHGRSVVVMPDGTLRVGCYSSSAYIIVALNSNGTTLTSYGTSGIVKVSPPGASAILRGLAVQSDGKLIFYGSSGQISGTTILGYTNGRLGRLTTTGALDTTFGTTGMLPITTGTESRIITSVEPLSSGSMMVMVQSGNAATAKTFLFRYLTDGTRDTTYATGGTFTAGSIPYPTGMYVDSTGVTTIVGSDPPTNRVLLQRVNASGVAVKTFAGDGFTFKRFGVTGDAPMGITGRASDGRVFVANTVSNGTTTDFNLLRIRPDGVADPNFDADGSVTTAIGIGMDVCAGIKQQSDGKLVLFGSSQAAATPEYTGFALARYFPGTTETDTAPTSASQPVSITVPVGSPASFTFGIGGNLQGSYVWRKGGSTISGQFGPTLSFAAVQLSDDAAYNATASTTQGSVSSNTVTLTVLAPPVVQTPPANVTGNYGTSADFTVTVSGRSPFTYQWQKDGVNYGTATSNTTSTTNTLTVPVEEANEGAYRVVVTNSNGNITSDAATLVANPSIPVIVTPPANQTVATGSDATFTVTVSGRSPYTYQWQKDTVDFGTPTTASASTTNSLVVPGIHANEGSYRVVVTNADGTATSSAATLVTEDHPPIITGNPVSRDILFGSTADLQVIATGRSPFTFQWVKDGVNEGSPVTQASGTHVFTVPALFLPVVGGLVAKYHCVVTNGDGTATSKVATVGMYSSGNFRLVPVNQLLRDGDPLTINAFLLHGTAVISNFQWKKDTKLISPFATTDASFTRDTISFGDAGTYAAVASTSIGTVTSINSQIGVVESGARSVAIALSKPFTLTAKATGLGLTFSWYKGTTPLTNGGRIAGADKASLVVSGAIADDAGPYHCVVSAYGNSLSTGDITVVPVTAKPVVNPVSFTNLRVGRAFTAQLSATNLPSSFTAAPLPAGLKLDAATGKITGTPTTAGTTQVKITATNPLGASAVVTAPAVVDKLFDSMTGAFTGLLNLTGGMMSLTVLPTGAYTGKLILGNGTATLTTLSFSGALIENEETGYYTSTSTSMTLPATIFGGGNILLMFGWSSSDGYLTADLFKIGQAVSLQSIAVFKNPWNATTKPANAYAGYYTCFMDPTYGQTPTEASRGTGYASLTIAKTGTFVLAGKLPDGTAVAVPSFVDANGDAPIFAWQYGNKGALSGSVAVIPGPAPAYYNGHVGGSLSWTRPGSRGASTISSGNVFFMGFTDAAVEVNGSRYTPPSSSLLTNARMLDAGAGPNNVLLSYDGGVSEYGFTEFQIYSEVPTTTHITTLTDKHQITPHAAPYLGADVASDYKLDSFVFTAATGAFTGKGVYYQWNYDSDSGQRTTLAGSAPITFQGITVTELNPYAPFESRARGFTNNTVTVKLDDGTGVFKSFPILISGGVAVDKHVAQ